MGGLAEGVHVEPPLKRKCSVHEIADAAKSVEMNAPAGRDYFFWLKFTSRLKLN